MQKRTVFLLQDTKEQNEELALLFKGDERFEVIGMATDGITGISTIVEKKPNYVIMEVILPGYDGLSVLEKAKEVDCRSKFLMLSAFCNQTTVNKALSLGAKYFMAKPFKGEQLKARLIDIDEEKQETALPSDSVRVRDITIDEKISKIFINVGIPPHIKGYVFLREGVKMAVNDPMIINNITKKLYPKIGEKFDTTPSKVERAIRHAIEVAWNRGRIESINSILGVRAYVGAEKPTNGEFIALVADKMLLEMA